MATSSSTPPQTFEVFLSFRGEDTRNTFISYLRTALKHRGITSFMDEEDLMKGESIKPELLRVIEDAKLAIIVFSKDYASSTWCLDELVKIMECRSEYHLTVIPIFYHIDPSDIRNQKNSFAKCFAEHERNFKDEMEKVQTWKKNLREAANISGYDFRNNIQEAPLVSKIVEQVFSKLLLIASHNDLVGIEHRLKELCPLLARQPNAVCFLGIWGMGGIGKTITARAIFNELINRFEGGCFLQDVCKKDIVDLQKVLLLKVLRTHINIYDKSEGSNMIRTRLCSKRVLLVLDDVNHINQLESLAGSSKWFGSGSRIIITTRDKYLLNNVNELYKIDTLSDIEFLQLFRSYPFRRIVQYK